MSTKKTDQKNSRKNVAEAAAVKQPPAADTPVMTGELVAEQPLQPVQVFELPLTAIVPNPANPRRYFDDGSLAELAQNIIEHGVLQSVTVREVDREDGKRYEIIFGERRCWAAAVAGLYRAWCAAWTMTPPST